MEKGIIQAQGHQGGVKIQVKEVGKGKLPIIWGDSGGVVLEGSHGEAE